MSTPSETIRTATSQRWSEAANVGDPAGGADVVGEDHHGLLPRAPLQQPRVRPGGLLVAGDDQAAGVGHALPGAARCSRASAARSTCGIQSPAGSSAVRHACAIRSWVIGSPRRAASSSPATVRQRVSPE